MPINFPSNPTLNQTYTSGSTTWRWSGSGWEIQPLLSPSFTNISVSGTISGNLSGIVTGTVSSISNHSLDDLGDVVFNTAPTGGEVLTYNNTSNAWEAALLSSTFTGGTVPNPINITNSTNSSSSSTGAFRTSGGIGLLGNLHAGGSGNFEQFIFVKTTGEVRLGDVDNTNYVALRSPAIVGTSITWTLPAADGSPGQFLSTNGSGTLSWATAAGGGAGGTTPPGGSNNQIQFNDNNTFAGSASLTFNSGTTTLTVPTLSITGNTTSSGSIATTNNTASTSTTTGAVRVTGGVGIGGQLNVGGAVNRFTGTTVSTSTSTGALIIAGGIGIGGDANIGGNVTSSALPTVAAHLTNKAYVDSNVLAFSIAFGV